MPLVQRCMLCVWRGVGVHAWCVCVCACLKRHTSLALAGIVYNPNNPGWPCFGYAVVCLLMCVQGSTLTPINLSSPGPLPTPALQY